MEFKKIYLTASVIALTCSQYAVASPLDNTSHTHTQHTLELKPISNSFQIAAAVFLPEKGEDLGFNGRELNDNHGNKPKIDLCTKFPLTSCPANATCADHPDCATTATKKGNYSPVKKK